MSSELTNVGFSIPAKISGAGIARFKMILHTLRQEGDILAVSTVKCGKTISTDLKIVDLEMYNLYFKTLENTENMAPLRQFVSKQKCPR